MTGVVGFALRVTGLAAMSISAEVTFMPGRCGSSNSSQYGFDSGVSCRLIFMITVLEFAMIACTLIVVSFSPLALSLWLLALSS